MMRVTLRNERSGELKELKVGFSWTLLLFSSFFGVPLFMRGLNQWGQAFLAWSLLSLFSLFFDAERVVAMGNIVGLISFLCAIYMGFQGNKLTAKHLFKNGWSFTSNDHVTQHAKQQWSLA